MPAAPEGAERRRHARAPVGLQVRLVVAGLGYDAPAVLRDLSESGCFFNTMAKVETGWTVSMSFLLKPRDLCEAQGRVVRAQHAKGFGVQFEQANGTLLRLVDTLLATPQNEQQAVLQELCDPVIEIGYVRRPDGSATDGPVPDECPKCGCRLSALKQAGAPSPSSCPRCGLVFSMWTPEQAAQEVRLDERGEALWADAVAAWDAPERHDAFLKHCSLEGMLAVAGRRYRQRLDDAPADPIAARMQDRVLAMATARFVRPPLPAAAPITRSLLFWIIIVLCGVGGVAGAMFRTANLKPAAPPPTAPALAPHPAAVVPPAVTPPAATQPAVIPPAVTQPAVTQPAVTGPHR